MLGEFELNLDVLSQIVGIAFSLLFTYVPGAKDWFDGLASKNKPLVMLGVNFLVLAVLFGFSCGQIVYVAPCTVDGGLYMLRLFVQAMIANQATYLVTRKIS